METKKIPVWEQRLMKFEAFQAEQERVKKTPFTACEKRTRSSLIYTKQGIPKVFFTESV